VHDDFIPSAERFSLYSLGILDGPPDATFDFIVNTISEILHVPMCLISVIDDTKNRQHFLASVGLPSEVKIAREIPLSHSVCQHVRNEGLAMQFRSTEIAPELAGNFAPRKLNAKSYAGSPILGPDGNPIGAICAIDTVPRIWTSRDAGYLDGFAEIVNMQIAQRATVETLKIIARKKSVSL